MFNRAIVVAARKVETRLSLYKELGMTCQTCCRRDCMIWDTPGAAIGAQSTQTCKLWSGNKRAAA